MIFTYFKNKNKLEKSQESALDASIIWVDIINMTKEEEKLVESHLGIDVPSKEETESIEVSNRLYTANDATFITLSLVNQDLSSLINHHVTFILFENKLITIRYEDNLLSFKTLISK